MIRFTPVLHVVSLLLLLISFFMLIPLGIALFGGDLISAEAFGITIILTTILCAVLWWFSRPRNGSKHHLRTREGFLMVTASWITASAVGAVPFVLSGAIPSYTNAFFRFVFYRKYWE